MPLSDGHDRRATVGRLHEAVAFFAGANKRIRERWVCQELLRSAGIQFAEAEITSPADEPPDVAFRGARFEVKELLDAGRRRHSEYKEALSRALTGEPTDYQTTNYTPKDIDPIGVGELVQEKLSELAQKYPSAVRAELDALLYVNLSEHWLSSGPMPASENFSQYGWRSIAVVFGGRHSFIFHTTSNAPDFLRNRVGMAFTVDA